MVWAVVKFPREQSVEVVPIAWYVKKSQECFWPPTEITRFRIISMIKNCDEPDTNWKVYPAVLLGKYEDLSVAQKKLKKAETISDLSSNNEAIITGRGLRKKKVNSRYLSRDDSESSLNISSSDENTYPNLNIKPNSQQKSKKRERAWTRSSPSEMGEGNTKFARKSRSLSREENSDAEHQDFTLNPTRTLVQKKNNEGYQHLLTSLTPRNNIRNDNNEGEQLTLNSSPTDDMAKASKEDNFYLLNQSQQVDSDLTPKVNMRYSRNEERQNYTSMLTLGPNIQNDGNEGRPLNPLSQAPKDNDEGFKKAVFEELSLINLKLDSVIDKLSSITKILSLNSLDLGPVTDNNFKELYEKIPIDSEVALQNMEEFLADKKNYRILLVELQRVGGSSISQSVRKILYRVLSNEVAQNYSWDGAKQKKAFKSHLANVILDSTKLQYKGATETEIINIIKIWLVKASQRLKFKNLKDEKRPEQD